MFSIVNLEDVPDDLASGKYCCRLIEASWKEFKLFFTGQKHVEGTGCCLIQMVKHETEE